MAGIQRSSYTALRPNVRMKFPLNKEGGEGGVLRRLHAVAKRLGVVGSAFPTPFTTTHRRLRLLPPFSKGDLQDGSELGPTLPE